MDGEGGGRERDEEQDVAEINKENFISIYEGALDHKMIRNQKVCHDWVVGRKTEGAMLTM